MSIRITPGNALKFTPIRRPPASPPADEVAPVRLGPGPGYRRDFTPAAGDLPPLSPPGHYWWTFFSGIVCGFALGVGLALLLAGLHH